jgi:hypothetical protein
MREARTARVALTAVLSLCGCSDETTSADSASDTGSGSGSETGSNTGPDMGGSTETETETETETATEDEDAAFSDANDAEESVDEDEAESEAHDEQSADDSASANESSESHAAVAAAEAMALPAEAWPADDNHEIAPAATAAAALPTSDPGPRPEWAEDAPRMVGEVYRIPVHAGPYVRREECYAELRKETRRAVERRVTELLHEQTGSEPPFVNSWFISDSYIDRELLRETYVEVADTSVGPMQTVWALLEFTPTEEQRLVRDWKAVARRQGIAMTIALGLGVLAIVASVFALLQIDTWTRGYYTKRLFLGIPAAIIGAYMLMALMFG